VTIWWSVENKIMIDYLIDKHIGEHRGRRVGMEGMSVAGVQLTYPYVYLRCPPPLQEGGTSRTSLQFNMFLYVYVYVYVYAHILMHPIHNKIIWTLQIRFFKSLSRRRKSVLNRIKKGRRVLVTRKIKNVFFV
jgi:hypothetical protein